MTCPIITVSRSRADPSICLQGRDLYLPTALPPLPIIRTFTFTDVAQDLPPFYPELSRRKIRNPIQVDKLVVKGHQTSLFKDGDHGEEPCLDRLQSTFVRSFDPQAFHMIGLDPAWHCRTNICGTFQRYPSRQGWDRLERLVFQGASLYSPLQSSSFASRAWPVPYGWSVTFEVQSSSHPRRILSKTHCVDWLINLTWHIFQRDSVGWGRLDTFPNAQIPRFLVLVRTLQDQTDALRVLHRFAVDQLGLVGAVDRMLYVDVMVGRV